MKGLLIHLLLVCWVLALTSCAAVYTYKHETQVGDTCSVTIYSRREVGGPVSFEADKDCSVKTGTGSLTGGEPASAEGLAERLLLRYLPTPVAATGQAVAGAAAAAHSPIEQPK